MLERLIRCLTDAALDLDAASVADALWLLRHMEVEAEDTTSSAPATTSRREQASSKPLRDKEETPSRQLEDDQAGLHALTEEAAGQRHAVKTFAATGRGLPQALEIARSLRPFKAHFRNPAQHELDADATVERYAETERLTPVLVPVRERWFSVDLVVDTSVSMRLWEDVVAETRALLRQTGAFRTIEQWYLDPDSCELRTVNGAVVPPKRLRDPQERRLVLLISDCIADGWRGTAVWQLVRTWASSTHTALINPLPPKLWRRTGLDHPAARLHADRPGAPNTALRLTLPPVLDVVAPGEQWLPLPVVRLSPTSIAQWASAVMTMDSAGCEGVLLPSSGRLPIVDDDDEWTPHDMVHSFRLRASPLAWRTAVLSSANTAFPLRLLRVIQRELVPEAQLSDLAEVVVSGLFKEVRGGDPAELTLEFRPGVADELRAHLSKMDDWNVGEVLTSFLDREAASSEGSVAGLVLREGGEHLLPERLRPYAHARTGGQQEPSSQRRGTYLGFGIKSAWFVTMTKELLPEFHAVVHFDLTKNEVQQVLEELSNTRLNGPLIIAWSGRSTDGGNVFMLETSDTNSYIGVDELVRAGIASGADQILVLLDTHYYMLHSGPKITSDVWPALQGNAEWVGVVSSAAEVGDNVVAAASFGEQIDDLLTQGPKADEDRLRWLRGQDQVDGNQFTTALLRPWGEVRRPRHHQYGVPRPMLPNPLRGLDITPPIDMHLLAAARSVPVLDPLLSQAVETVVGWVRSGFAGVYVVAGPAGTGKTTAVGHVVGLSHPGESSVDANVCVRRMTVAELAESIGRQFLLRDWDLPSFDTAAALLELADVLVDIKGAPPVVVVDGVDEAHDERDVARFLADLGQCCTVVVTTRNLLDELEALDVALLGPDESSAVQADEIGELQPTHNIVLSVEVSAAPLYPLFLRTHAGALAASGRHEDAANQLREALSIYLFQPVPRPPQSLGPIMLTLIELVRAEVGSGAVMQAASTLNDAIVTSDSLAADEINRSDLVEVALELSAAQSANGLHKSAVQSAQAAVRLAEHTSAEGHALHGLTLRLRDAGDPEAALRTGYRALNAYLPATHDYPITELAGLVLTIDTAAMACGRPDAATDVWHQVFARVTGDDLRTLLILRLASARPGNRDAPRWAEQALGIPNPSRQDQAQLHDLTRLHFDATPSWPWTSVPAWLTVDRRLLALANDWVQGRPGSTPPPELRGSAADTAVAEALLKLDAEAAEWFEARWRRTREDI